MPTPKTLKVAYKPMPAGTSKERHNTTWPRQGTVPLHTSWPHGTDHTRASKSTQGGWTSKLSLGTSQYTPTKVSNTMVGFGSLMIASHQGLQSLGRVLTLGVSCCLFTSLIILPAILILLTKTRPDLNESDEIDSHPHLKMVQPRLRHGPHFSVEGKPDRFGGAPDGSFEPTRPTRRG